MNVSNLINTLKSYVSILSALTPLLTPFGGEAVVKGVAIVQTALDLVALIQTRVAEGKVVLSSNNAADIAEITKRLQDENDRLNTIIAAS